MVRCTRQQSRFLYHHDHLIHQIQKMACILQRPLRKIKKNLYLVKFLEFQQVAILLQSGVKLWQWLHERTKTSSYDFATSSHMPHAMSALPLYPRPSYFLISFYIVRKIFGSMCRHKFEFLCKITIWDKYVCFTFFG